MDYVAAILIHRYLLLFWICAHIICAILSISVNLLHFTFTVVAYRSIGLMCLMCPMKNVRSKSCDDAQFVHYSLFEVVCSQVSVDNAMDNGECFC